ncbi:hypothetical protein RF11_10004 [Thelohanellus kitauei]|uniref:Uncharacterized protein n=1 Tax=Thelohanellus kitauei TaxID=669202 RepID=A0A0C2N4J4_THEKT|nr:hypothetical protein RF11_10004 [Thelohanellus kitauei]
MSQIVSTIDPEKNIRKIRKLSRRTKRAIQNRSQLIHDNMENFKDSALKIKFCKYSAERHKKLSDEISNPFMKNFLYDTYSFFYNHLVKAWSHSKKITEVIKN